MRVVCVGCYGLTLCVGVLCLLSVLVLGAGVRCSASVLTACVGLHVLVVLLWLSGRVLCVVFVVVLCVGFQCWCWC